MPQTLVLHWDRRQLFGVLSELDGSGPQVQQAFSLTWPDDLEPLQMPAKSADLLKQRLATLEASPQRVVVCLSREDVILRHLDVPAVPDDELPAVVAFQAASRSTLPLEQLTLDFLPLPPLAGHAGRPVLAVTAPKSLVNGIQSLLQAADLDTASVTFSSIGLGEFLAQTEKRLGHEPRQAVLGIVRDGPRVELVVLANRQVLYAHSARISADDPAPQAGLLAEVSRTIVAAQRLHPQLSVHHAWIFEEDAATPELARQLTERLGAPAKILELSGIQWAQFPAARLPGPKGLIAALTGLSVAASDRLTAGFDFLHPRQPPKKLDLRKQRVMVGSAAALVLAALVTSGLQWTKHSLEQRIDALRSQEAELDLKIAPGKATLEAARLVENWQSGNLNQLQQFSTLEDLMEGTDELYLSQYGFTAGGGEAVGTVQAFGNAKTREDIARFYQRLIDTKTYRIQPRAFQTSRDDEYPHRFELNAELLPRPKDLPKPLGEKAKS